MNICFDIIQGLLNLAPLDYLTFAGIGTILTGITAVIGLIISLRNDRHTRILGFIKETDQEISSHIEKENELKNFSECITYTYIYLDIMERIAFLCDDNDDLKKYGVYYKTFFNYAVTMMGWYTTAYDDKHKLEESWPKLVLWFQRNVMNPYDAEHLPELLITELKHKNLDPNSIFIKLKEQIPKMQTTWDIINEKRFET